MICISWKYIFISYVAVDGNWADWTQWTTCTQTCGTGSTTRSRICSNPTPLHGGAYCVGDPGQGEECNRDPCPGID